MADTKCAKCGHAADDHDGYAGMCDGLGWNDARQVCTCQQFVPPRSVEGAAISKTETTGVAAPMPDITHEHRRAMMAIYAYAPTDVWQEITDIETVLRALASGTHVLVSVEEIEALYRLAPLATSTHPAILATFDRWLTATHTEP